ncbi:MAG: IclR family transcriptional regulator [Deltaproteobacteria bacterium]|nr:IclR family transcriptional regulator [Deltaproteobacteria bacterium]
MKTKKDHKQSDRYNVPAIEQAARVLFCLAENETSHLSLTEICSKVGIHSGRAFSIMQTLQKFGFAQRNIGGKGYSLGPGLLMLSRKVLDSFDVPRLAEPILKDLAKKADSTATLGLIVDDQIFVISKNEGGVDVGITARIGRRFHISHSAEGKAIAAFLPEKDLEELLQSKELYFHGSPEFFNKERLLEEIEECRRVGYALDIREANQRLNAVAAPVFGSSGNPIGHITVIGLLSENWARELGPMVFEAAKTLSQQLGHQAQ